MLVLSFLFILASSETLYLSDSDTFIVKDIVEVQIGQRVSITTSSSDPNYPVAQKMISQTKIGSLNFSNDTAKADSGPFQSQQLLTWGSSTPGQNIILVYLQKSIVLYSLNVNTQELKEISTAEVLSAQDDREILSVCLFKDKTTNYALVQTFNQTSDYYYWYVGDLSDLTNVTFSEPEKLPGAKFTQQYVDYNFPFLPVFEETKVYIFDISNITYIQPLKLYNLTNVVNFISDEVSSLYALDQTEGLSMYFLSGQQWTSKNVTLELTEGYEFSSLFAIGGTQNIAVKTNLGTTYKTFALISNNPTYSFDFDIESMQTLYYGSPDAYYYAVKSVNTLDFYYTDRQDYFAISDIDVNILSRWVGFYSQNYYYIVFITDVAISVHRVMLSSPSFYLRGDSNYTASIEITGASNPEFKYTVESFPNSHDVKQLNNFVKSKGFQTYQFGLFFYQEGQTYSINEFLSDQFSGFDLSYYFQAVQGWENWEVTFTEKPYIRQIISQDIPDNGDYIYGFYDSIQTRILYINQEGVYNITQDLIFNVTNVKKSIVNGNSYLFYSESQEKAELNHFFFAPDLVHQNLTADITMGKCTQVVQEDAYTICVAPDKITYFYDFEYVGVLDNNTFGTEIQFYSCFPMTDSMFLIESKDGTFQYLVQSGSSNKIDILLPVSNPVLTVFYPDLSVGGFYIQVHKNAKNLFVNIYSYFYTLFRSIDTGVPYDVDDIMWFENLQQIVIYANDTLTVVRPFNSEDNAVVQHMEISSTLTVTLQPGGYITTLQPNPNGIAIIWEVASSYEVEYNLNQTSPLPELASDAIIQVNTSTADGNSIAKNITFILANYTVVYQNETYNNLTVTRDKESEIALNSFINGNSLEFQFKITEQGDLEPNIFPASTTVGAYVYDTLELTSEPISDVQLFQTGETEGYLFVIQPSTFTVYKLTVNTTENLIVEKQTQTSVACDQIYFNGIQNSVITATSFCSSVDRIQDSESKQTFIYYDTLSKNLTTNMTSYSSIRGVGAINLTYSLFFFKFGEASGLHVIQVPSSTIVFHIGSDLLGLEKADWVDIRTYTLNSTIYFLIKDTINGVILVKTDLQTYDYISISPNYYSLLDMDISSEGIMVVDTSGNRKYYDIMGKMQKYIVTGQNNIGAWGTFNRPHGGDKYGYVYTQDTNMRLLVQNEEALKYTIQQDTELHSSASPQVDKRIMYLHPYMFIGFKDSSGTIVVVKNQGFTLKIPALDDTQYNLLKDEWGTTEYTIVLDATSKYGQKASATFKLDRSDISDDDSAVVLGIGILGLFALN